jgi:release factor glutamine methyltransferase
VPGVPRSPDRLIGRTSVHDALDSAVIALTASGADTPRLDAELLLAAAMGVDRAAIVAEPGRALEPDAARRFQEYAARRREREPVAYILGSKGFRSIELEVDPRVLIPRPETEHLVEALLDLPRGARVCDVGTGSGAIALAIAYEHPGSRVVAIDASEQALSLARANVERTGVDIELHRHDFFVGLPSGPWQLVVSNPPYVEPEELRTLMPDVRDWEPHEALVAEGATETIAEAARDVLAQDGALVLEVADGKARAVVSLLEQLGYDDVVASTDLAGRDRVVEGTR